MDEHWERIEAWLMAQLPAINVGLNTGANASQIVAAEVALGVHFPADVRDAYLRHNGQEDTVYAIYDHWAWYSLALVVSQWRAEMALYDAGEFQEADAVVRPDGPVRQVWWHPHWIPLAGNASGDYVCLDLAPAAEGSIGQIITFWHADERRRVVAPSFTALLARIAARLAAGEIGLNVNGAPVRLPGA